MRRPARPLKQAMRLTGAPALAALSLVLACAGAAQAQGVEPGLWEFKHDIRIPGQPDVSAQMAQMRQQMKTMPPQLRQMMEQQLASMGVGIGEGGALRVCMSAEDARRGPVREGQRDNDCTYTQVKRSGNSWSGRVRCADPVRQGEFSTTLHSAAHFNTRAVLDGADGRTEMNMDARRLGADCGAVAERPRR